LKELVWHRQLLPSIARHATRPFLIDASTGASTTYGEHGSRVLKLADGLRTQLGVQPEDRFAVLSLNSPRFEELYHAGLLGAGVVNPLNLRFAPRELTHVLADSATKVVFVDQVFAPLIDAVRAAAGVEKVVLMGDGDAPHDVRYEDLVAAGEEVVPEEPDEDAPAMLMYTGGTTGLPKGVLLTQRTWRWASGSSRTTSSWPRCRCSTPPRWARSSGRRSPAGSWSRSRSSTRASCSTWSRSTR
jgi:acyl-CoA synthetase (AMP-forming)/AMP-acid ligase II